MKKVFVINRAGHDYSKAHRFGEVVFCTDGEQDRFNTNQMFRIFSPIFDASSRDDYILLTSLTIMCSIACAIFARKHGRLNLLLYRDGKYIERTILLDNGLSSIDDFLIDNANQQSEKDTHCYNCGMDCPPGCGGKFKHQPQCELHED